jgi:hypothetical protein
MSTQSILAKWRKQEYFCRFLDGDTLNCRLDNLRWVTKKDAMDHFEEWRFDWDCHLTSEECELVMTPAWRKGLVFNEIKPHMAPAKSTKKKGESEEDKVKRIEANKKFIENSRQKTSIPVKKSQKVPEIHLHTARCSASEESEHVRKVREREAAESKARAEEERARREKIAADRKARANASAKPYTAPGVSHKSKDAGDVEAAPDVSARAKRTARKAVAVESVARHVEALKIAEHERVAVEEAKLELRRVGRAIGGS